MERLSRSLSEEERAPGGAFIGDPESYVKKGSGYGISLHRGPFRIEGKLESGGGFIYWRL